MPRKSSSITVTDLFCGAGGSSLGASWTGVEIALAMNHWQRAVDTHNRNFPNTKHDCTDISAADPRRYPSTRILIGSPECTNHSLAKGVRRKDAHYVKNLFGDWEIDPAEERSRATMWDIVRFTEYHQYEIVIVENVVDARRWVLFEPWLQAMHSLGYEHECVYLNSMFAHPTPQSRDRMYVVFWKRGNKRPNLHIEPRAYCDHCGKDVDAVQSWKNLRKQWGKYGQRNQYIYCCPTCRNEVQPYFFAAANAIDWTILGERIGDRKTPLKPRTIERIEYGLRKFGRQPQMIQTDYTHSDSPRARTVSDAMPTQSTRQVLGLMMPMIFSSNSGGKNDHPVREVSDPLPTQVASGQPWMVTPFLTSTNYFADRPIPVDEPLPTQTTAGKSGITIAPFMIANDRNVRATSVDQALPTQTADRQPKLIVPPFVTSQYGGRLAVRETNEPLPTISTFNNQHQLVTPPFIVEMYKTGMVRSIMEALGTMLTVGHHAIAQPGELPNVDDCYFRMLKPHEIGRGMAFPDEYIVLGPQRDQIRMYGNAVTPPVMRLLVERCMETLL